jgi:hypothetical protein
LRDEAKVGAMLRYMTGDVALGIKDLLADLYDDTKVELDPVKCCAKWHWILVKYATDPVLVRKYISLIEYAKEYGVSLDTLPTWRRTMRIVIPEEFIYTIKSIATQVPRLAVMDDTHAEMRRENIKARDFSEVLW